MGLEPKSSYDAGAAIKTSKHDRVSRFCILICFFLFSEVVSTHAFECNNCVVLIRNGSPYNWDEWSAKTSNKPASLSQKDAAHLLAMASSQVLPDLANKNELALENRIITKWQKPLRIRLVDGNDDDLPLEESPGKGLATYLQNISSTINLPILITTKQAKDNNITLLLAERRWTEVKRDNIHQQVGDKQNKTRSQAVDPASSNIGEISGVPELVSDVGTLPMLWRRENLPKGFWQGGAYKWNGAINFEAYLNVRYSDTAGETKGCFIFLRYDWANAPSAETIVQRFNTLFLNCLGLVPQSKFREELNTTNAARWEAALHASSLFFLRQLYKANIVPGMSALIAEKKIIDEPVD